MKWLTLSKIKQQLRIEPDFTEEDELLTMYGESAEEAIENIIRCNADELSEFYGRIPTPIVHASLLLVAACYKDRESTVQQQIYANPTFSLLLKPYMILTDK